MSSYDLIEQIFQILYSHLMKFEVLNRLRSHVRFNEFVEDDKSRTDHHMTIDIRLLDLNILTYFAQRLTTENDFVNLFAQK